MANRERFEIEQSGVIAWRNRGVAEELEVLLVTSSTRRRWVIPKGHVEDDQSHAESAAREAFEEAGVKGQIESRPLGTFAYTKLGQDHRVEVYLLEVDEVAADWPEAHRRRRKWMSVPKAVALVAEEKLKELLRRAERKLAGVARV